MIISLLLQFFSRTLEFGVLLHKKILRAFDVAVRWLVLAALFDSIDELGKALEAEAWLLSEDDVLQHANIAATATVVWLGKEKTTLYSAFSLKTTMGMMPWEFGVQTDRRDWHLATEMRRTQPTWPPSG
jgi:hypothetical protein